MYILYADLVAIQTREIDVGQQKDVVRHILRVRREEVIKGGMNESGACTTIFSNLEGFLHVWAHTTTYRSEMPSSHGDFTMITEH